MKSILWLSFEIIINIYQSFMVVYFVYKLLTPKRKQFAKTGFAICWIVLFILLTLMNYITIFESAASILYMLCLLIYAVIMLNGNIVKKLLISVLPFTIIFLITAALLNFISSLNSMTINEIVAKLSLERFIALLSIQATIYISFRLIIKAFDFSSESFHLTEWIVTISVLVASIVMAALLHYSAIYSMNYKQRTYISLSILVLMAINILVFHMIDSLLKKNRMLQEMEILKVQERYQKQYIENANMQYDSIRKIRHDLKNQFYAVYALLNENKYEDAKNYISKGLDVFVKSEPVVRTDNTIVNSIINSKLSMASAMGISVQCLSVNHFDNIDEIDLCNLLSNALENAVTACMNANSDKVKFISVRITKENDIYTFLIKNTIENSVLKDNPRLITTKKDKDKHGFGTKILKDIAEKYNGRCDFYEKDNVFCCKIILKTFKSGSES
ncbi:MAG: sensor histidine kinase [Oscillospiraceae bacterium]